jgi:hypothetical protein
MDVANLLDLLFRLAECESLGLSEIIREKDAVMLISANGIERVCWGQEICGDELCTLVNKLIERVLSVRPCGSPQNGLYVPSANDRDAKE